MLIEECMEGETLSPARVADILRTSRREIAGTLGLGGDALSRTARIRAPKAQTRIREMLEILNRVETQTGSLPGKGQGVTVADLIDATCLRCIHPCLAAYAWFRSEPMQGFGGMVPAQLLREDVKASHVHAYLDRYHGMHWRLCLTTTLVLWR